MLQRLLAIVRKELIGMLRVRRARMSLIIPPVIQLLIFAQAATMEVKNIELAIEIVAAFEPAIGIAAAAAPKGSGAMSASAAALTNRIAAQMDFIHGGESGIRTHGTRLTYTRFPSVRLKPLGHLSHFRLSTFAFDNGGEGGIRTPDTREGITVFETAAFNHSATSPFDRAGAACGRNPGAFPVRALP